MVSGAYLPWSLRPRQIRAGPRRPRFFVFKSHEGEIRLGIFVPGGADRPPRGFSYIVNEPAQFFEWAGERGLPLIRQALQSAIRGAVFSRPLSRARALKILRALEEAEELELLSRSWP